MCCSSRKNDDVAVPSSLPHSTDAPLLCNRRGRGIIHPHIPNMGFVGYLEGPSSVLSGEISAIWLANLLQRMITLPNVATMESERRAWLRHCKRTRFFARSSACVATMQIWHNDKLCKDMGLKSLRKRTWWEEIFSIYVISDYKALTS